MSSGSPKTKTTPPIPWAGYGISTSPSLPRDRHDTMLDLLSSLIFTGCHRPALDTSFWIRLSRTNYDLLQCCVPFAPALIPNSVGRKPVPHSINSRSFRHGFVPPKRLAFWYQFSPCNVQPRTIILTRHFDRLFPSLRLATSSRHVRQYLASDFPWFLLCSAING